MSSRRDVLLGTLGMAAAASFKAGVAAAQTSPPPSAGSSILSSSAPPYEAGKAERPLDIINLYDLEAEAEKLIPKAQFGYIAGGSGDEWTLKENTRAFDDRQILPRYP
jgi:lactate oxidase